MNIIEKAFRELFPNRQFNYVTKINYSGHFNDYGANIRSSPRIIELNLSKKWRGVSEEIKIGLIQELLVSVFKAKKNTTKMDLYNTFVKKLAAVVPKTKIDPDLLDSFNRINERYFYDLMDVPNLEWGSNSVRKLGSYDFKADCITISSALQEEDLLDYVMYHEMLHKKHKFSANKGRNLFHSAKFRKAEKEFENASEMEKRLKRLAFKSNLRKLLPF